MGSSPCRDHDWRDTIWTWFSPLPDSYRLSASYCKRCPARRVYLESSQTVLGGRETMDIARQLIALWNAAEPAAAPQPDPLDFGDDADEGTL